MIELWNLRIELTVGPQDFPSGATVGFMNVILSATSAANAQGKLESYFATFKWHILAVEEAKILSPDFVAEDDEFAEMLERARLHPDPIILGAFHSYKTN